MKKIKFLGLLVLLLMILPAPKIFAQVKKFEMPDYELSIKNDDGKVLFTFYGGLEEIKITPSGNLKRTLTFQLPLDHRFMYYAWAKVSVTLNVDINEDGVDDIKIKDKRSVLTPNGLLKIDVHYNPNKVYDVVDLEE